MPEKCKGIVLFDNDNTLMDTPSVFDQGMTLAAEALNNGQISKQTINEVQSGILMRIGVDPLRIWPATINQIKREYKLADHECKRALDCLMSIYQIVPSLFSDTLSTLESIVCMGYRLGLVTHARRDWTTFKLKSNGLEKYFKNPCIIGVRGHKSADSWRRAVRHYKASADKEIWVVGDSLRSDIKPAFESGITKNLIWIDRDSKWVVDYGTSHLAEDCKAITVKQLQEIPEIVRRGRDLNPR